MFFVTIDSMIILYPTDTLYGLGVDATDSEAIKRLNEIKGRGAEKHISIAVSDMEMMMDYAELTPLGKKLAERFLPGKLTLVLKPKSLPLELGTGTEEIGIRIPSHEKALELIQELGKPITATSANLSGMKPENSPERILKQFGEKASMIDRMIDGGELPESLPSTVVDARGDTPIIIREGAISASDIAKCLEE